MTSFSTFLLIIMILLLGFAGYYYLDVMRPMQDSVHDLNQEKQELAFQLEQFQQANEALAAQLDEQVRAVSEEKESEIAQLKGTYEKLISELNDQVEKGEVTITQLADRLKVNMVDRIIFPSGQAELSEDGIQVLKRVGAILGEATSDKYIRVEGHTDNVPIHPNLQDKFSTNWELSAARATNVVRFLQENVGIEASKLEISAYADSRPIASNKTRSGRAKNRRIEVVLIPISSETPR